MLAWLDWWDEYYADRKGEQHAELTQAVSAFTAACTEVRIYAPEYVVKELMVLKKRTAKFDKFAESNRDPEGWTDSDRTRYEKLRMKADNAMPKFIRAARASIEELLNGNLG
jgi:hypothetical protein